MCSRSINECVCVLAYYSLKVSQTNVHKQSIYAKHFASVYGSLFFLVPVRSTSPKRTSGRATKKKHVILHCNLYR